MQRSSPSRLLSGLFLSVVCLFLSGPAPAGERIPVLCIAETPETQEITYYNGAAFTMYVLDYFLSPKHVLSDAFAVTQVGWLDAPKELANLAKYKAVVLWECPRRITDKRGTDVYYRDLEVVSDEHARKLVEWVEGGGALVVMGGVTCYGDGHERLGSADYRRGNSRHYVGFRGSPLAAILPVEIPEGVTLRPFAGKVKDPRAPEPAKAVVSKEVEAGLKWLAKAQEADGHWDSRARKIQGNPSGLDAYHKLKARDGAEVLKVTDGGDPLIARRGAGKGKVVCIAASPRGNALLRSPNDASDPLRFWEAVECDEQLRWVFGLPSMAGRFVYIGPPVSSAESRFAFRAHHWLLTESPLAIPLAEFPYGTHVVEAAFPTAIGDLAARYFADLGMNHIVLSGFAHIGKGGAARSPEQLDAYLKSYSEFLEKNNLYMFLEPAPAAGARIAKIDPKEWAQVTLPSGKFAGSYGEPSPCPFSPTVIKYAKEQMELMMPVVAKYPRVRGAFCDDEWAWVMGYRNAYEGSPGIACYSPWANERFKRLTGLDAPPPVYREPGYVAPENDPWLRWCQAIRQDACRDYNQALLDVARKHRPDFILSNYPGGFEGNTPVMVEEVYLDCWKESELEAFERIDVRANFREDRSRTKHPVWALIGIFRMPEDKSVYPETLRLTVGCCLGAGAKGIILWNSVNLWAPWFQHPDRGSLDAEAKRIGEYLRKFGPMFLNLKKVECRIWMLSGWFWVNSFDNYFLVPPEAKGDGLKPALQTKEAEDKERTWWTFQISDIAVPAAMRAGLHLEFVTEKQLLSGELHKKAAVILPGLLYCREGVVKNLEKYIAGGGKVFVDESTKVKIAGAKVLPVDFSRWHYDVAAGKRPIAQPTEENYRKQRALREAYVEQAIPIVRKQVTKVINPRVLIRNPDGTPATEAAYTGLENGKTAYLFVYNTNVDKPNRFRLRVERLPMVVYDIEAGSPRLVYTSEKAYRFGVDLPAGGWKVFALAPRPLAEVKIAQAAATEKGLKLAVTLLDDEGGVFSGAVPLRIMLKGADHQVFTLYRATSEGKLDTEIPLGGAVPKPVSVSVTELFSGKAAEAKP